MSAVDFSVTEQQEEESRILGVRMGKLVSIVSKSILPGNDEEMHILGR